MPVLDALPMPTTAAGRAAQYLRERFPLAAHGPLVAVFSAGALGAAHVGAGAEGWPGAGRVVVAALAVLGFFFQLRVADEWKDLEADRTQRPYRPVPRGLVTLRELTAAAVVVAVVQLVLTLALGPALLPYLLGVWGFGALMTAEFFAPRWLEARPLAVLLSHGGIVPAMALYAAACGFAVDGQPVPDGLGWLLATAFVSGNVVEIGRKVRAGADEEPGVATYSALWGPRRAALVWLAAVGASLVGAWMWTRATDAPAWVLIALVPLVGLAAGAARPLLTSDPPPGAGRRIETAAAVWTLGVYLAVGPLALALR